MRPLELTENMGYLAIGDKIDPNDWKGASAEQITSYVLDEFAPVYGGESHDLRQHHSVARGGGDRRETVRALPMIIDGVRAKGFEVVSVADLLHMQRAEIMPPIATSELWWAWMTWIGFWLYSAGIKLIAITFFVGDLLMTGRLIFVGVFAIFDRLRSKRFSTARDSRQRSQY